MCPQLEATERSARRSSRRVQINIDTVYLTVAGRVVYRYGELRSPRPSAADRCVVTAMNAYGSTAAPPSGTVSSTDGGTGQRAQPDPIHNRQGIDDG
jgi:hypothetical protein